MNRQRRPDTLLNLSLAALLAALLAASLCAGPGGFHWLNGEHWESQLILWELRLPRSLLAILTGAALGLAGAALQGWLRNPLADPGVLGISSSAALFAVLCLYWGGQSLFWLSPLAGMLGAITGFLTLLALAGSRQDILVILLAGTAINAFAAAFTALLLNLAPNPFAMQDMLFWLMGSFENRSWTQVWWALPPALIGMGLLFRTGRSLDLLSLGGETAQSLGVNPRQLFWLVSLGSALAVGACVSVAGAIGFIGLLVPHLLRPWVDWEPRRLLLPSTLGGACLLLLADTGVRMLPPGQELRVGVLTALVGGPFFLFLLIHLRRRGELV